MRKIYTLLLIIFSLSINFGGTSAQLRPDIITLAWDRAGNRLAIGYEGGIVNILDVQTGVYSEIVRLVSRQNILSVAWHPTNTNLIIVGAASTSYWRVYDVSTNEMVNYLEVGSTSVSSVSWNVDGTLIVSAANWVRDRSEIPRVDIWNAFTNEFVASFEHGGYINDISWHPTDPYKLASASGSRSTRFWDVNLGGQYRPQIITEYGSTLVVWSPNGSQVAISQGSENGDLISIWNVSEESETPLRQFYTEDNGTVVWKYDGSLAISDREGVKITDIEGQEIFENKPIQDENGVGRYVNDLDWSINGDLAVGGVNGLLMYFTPNTYYIVDEVSDFANFIEMANANTSMNIFDVRGDFELTAPLPTVTGDITLIGNGAQIVMTGTGRVFDVASTGGLTLKNITVSGGNAVQGGAIYNAGDVTLENVVLDNNSATDGGAIYNVGNLEMDGGAIQNNTATNFGGGIYNLGEMDVDGVNIRDNNAPEGSGVYQGE